MSKEPEVGRKCSAVLGRLPPHRCCYPQPSADFHDNISAFFIWPTWTASQTAKVCLSVRSDTRGSSLKDCSRWLPRPSTFPVCVEISYSAFETEQIFVHLCLTRVRKPTGVNRCDCFPWTSTRASRTGGGEPPSLLNTKLCFVFSCHMFMSCDYSVKRTCIWQCLASQ